MKIAVKKVDREIKEALFRFLATVNRQYCNVNFRHQSHYRDVSYLSVFSAFVSTADVYIKDLDLITQDWNLARIGQKKISTTTFWLKCGSGFDLTSGWGLYDVWLDRKQLIFVVFK